MSIPTTSRVVIDAHFLSLILAKEVPALEATQGQMDGVFSPLPYECHVEEVVSVGG